MQTRRGRSTASAGTCRPTSTPGRGAPDHRRESVRLPLVRSWRSGSGATPTPGRFVNREKIEVAADDGRLLDVWVAGPSEATPVVMHHGTPTSGLPYQPFVDEVTQRGLR